MLLVVVDPLFALNSNLDGDAFADCVDPCRENPIHVVISDTNEIRCDSCKMESYNGKDYLFCRDSLTRFKAQRKCRRLGMFLAEVDDSAENTWLRDKANELNLEEFFIGLSDIDEEATYHWNYKSHSPNYLNFSSDSPNNELNDCVAVKNDGEWAFSNCGAPKNYVCRSYDHDDPINKPSSCEKIRVHEDALEGFPEESALETFSQNGIYSLASGDFGCEMISHGGGWTYIGLYGSNDNGQNPLAIDDMGLVYTDIWIRYLFGQNYWAEKYGTTWTWQGWALKRQLVQLSDGGFYLDKNSPQSSGSTYTGEPNLGSFGNLREHFSITTDGGLTICKNDADNYLNDSSRCTMNLILELQEEKTPLRIKGIHNIEGDINGIPSTSFSDNFMGGHYYIYVR